MSGATTEAWIDALQARHAAALRRPELLKAIRSLSARYVERRADLRRRSPIDSAGRRAAFGAYYAPLHFLTVRGVIDALGTPAAPADLIDAGCGTGVAGAAWATGRATRVAAVDRDSWAVAEARWNFRQLGCHGRARRGDMVRAICSTADAPGRSRRRCGVVAAWSVNELADEERRAMLDGLLALARRGSSILVIEPLALTAAPWWPDWVTAFDAVGGRADEWRLAAPVPDTLARLHAEAGFRRGLLKARSLFVAPGT